MSRQEFLASLYLWLALFSVGQAQDIPRPEMRLRIVPLFEGVRHKIGDKKVEETTAYQRAKGYGVNLAKPKHPLVAHNIDDKGRLYFVFYNQLDNALGDRPYVIQRVKKIEKFYDLDGSLRPTHTKYLVEAFKTNAGSIKGIDEHYGGYSMGKNTRREIIKELEIGFGEIPDICEGELWPFDSKKLYQEIQDYDKEESIYKAVKFHRSIKWTIKVGFTSKGQYRIVVPELKIDVPKEKTPQEVAQPWKDPDSRRVVLMAGKGCTGVVLRNANIANIRKVLGEPLEVVSVTETDVNYSFAKGVTVQVDNGTQVSTLFTRPSFAGKTRKGIRLGDTKNKVRKAYGKPKGKSNEWQYSGIAFRFDVSERVESIFIFPK